MFKLALQIESGVFRDQLDDEFEKADHSIQALESLGSSFENR